MKAPRLDRLLNFDDTASKPNRLEHTLPAVTMSAPVKAFADTYDDDDREIFDQGFELGYLEGAHVGQREATDLTLAGAIIVALVAGCVGIVFGVTFGAVAG